MTNIKKSPTPINLAGEIYKALVQPQHKYYRPINDVLALVTIISVLAFILETVPSLANWRVLFLSIEYITVGIFLTEYVIRLYYSSSRRRYATSFFGVIDLLSILPTFLGLGSFTFLKLARSARLLHALRLAKLFRSEDKE